MQPLLQQMPRREIDLGPPSSSTSHVFFPGQTIKGSVILQVQQPVQARRIVLLVLATNCNCNCVRCWFQISGGVTAYDIELGEKRHPLLHFAVVVWENGDPHGRLMSGYHEFPSVSCFQAARQRCPVRAVLVEIRPMTVGFSLSGTRLHCLDSLRHISSC